MRVLIFSSWYPNHEDPLNGSFFREQALALKKAGLDICVLSMTFYRPYEIGLFLKRKNKLEYQNDNGVETYRLHYLKFFPRMETLFLYYSAAIFKKTFHYIERLQGRSFDIVHIHSALNAGIIYYLSKIRTNYVLTEHSSMFQRDMLTGIQRKYVSLCCSSSRRLIAVGNGLKKVLSAFTDRPITIIYNLARMDLFFLTEKEHKASSKFRFFSLGMSAHTKGFDILLAAYSRIAMLESTELCIAGLLPDEISQLSNMVASYRLEGRVILREKLSREETARQMRIADCFVLTSRFETFGVVFVEAMACGKPVIATKTGGPDSFVIPGTGILVPVENIPATTAALETMFFKAASFDPVYIRNYAVENFSEAAITKKIIEIYEEIVRD